jgi:hypothetical protein
MMVWQLFGSVLPENPQVATVCVPIAEAVAVAV